MLLIVELIAIGAFLVQLVWFGFAIFSHYSNRAMQLQLAGAPA